MGTKQYVGLSNAERSEISILKKRGCGVRELAQALGRSPNTVSYEIKTNRVDGGYDPLKAKAKRRAARRYQWRKIEHHVTLRTFIIEKLSPPNHWSPDAIAGYLKHEQTALPYVKSTPGCTVPTVSHTARICTSQSTGTKAKQTGCQ